MTPLDTYIPMRLIEPRRCPFPGCNEEHFREGALFCHQHRIGTSGNPYREEPVVEIKPEQPIAIVRLPSGVCWPIFDTFYR